jgi:hypothetical protein
LQESDAVPPLLDEATFRPYDADVSVKAPPVEDDSVTAMLEAFTRRESAADPAVMVRIVTGDVRATWVPFE